MKPLSETMVESPAVTWNLNSSARYTASSPVIKSHQRPFTNPGRVRGPTNFTTIKLSSATSVRSHFGVRRFRTVPEQVCRRQGAPDGRVSYTLDYIRYLKRSNKETEAKLKETMNVLSMQRSQSDLDTGGDMAVNLQGGSMFGTGILGPQRSHTYFGNIPEHLRRESIAQGNKQEVKISKAVVPRKGLIQLTSSDDAPADGPFVIGGKGAQRSSGHSESHPYSPKGLIRRKSILKYIEAGTKLLEESEEIKTQEEEMTKSLGEYTILDLQSKILEMTDSTSQKKRPMGMMSAPKTPLPDVKKPGRLKDEGGKGVTLPAIKQLKIF